MNEDVAALLPLEVTDGEARITDEMVEAGAKALWRVFKGDRNWDHATPIMQDYYREQSRDCLSAALTQPQTERCPEDCDGFGRLIGDSDGPCPACSGLESDGGGAATAAGVADALTLTPGEARNLVDAAMGDEHYPQLLDSTVKRIGDEADRQLAEPTPYAKAFRERVCPVPEFPSVGTAPQEAQADPKKDVCPNCGEVANGCNYCRKTPAPVPQTEGECPDCGGTGRIRRQKDWRIDPCSFCSGTGYQLAVNDALAALTQKGDKE